FRDSVPALSRAFHSFTGTTDDGQFSIESVGQVNFRSMHPNVTKSESAATILWHLQGVKLERADRPRYSSVRYGITNLEFNGVPGAAGLDDLPLTLRESDAPVEVVIKPYQ